MYNMLARVILCHIKLMEVLFNHLTLNKVCITQLIRVHGCTQAVLYIRVKFYCSSDGACRHVGAALINLEETLRESTVVMFTGSKCM